MRRLIVILAPAILISGCGLAHQIQARKDATEAQKTFAAERADCERQFPDRNAKPATPRIRCLNGALLKQHAVLERVPNSIRQSDLVQVLASRMLVVAEQYDAGRLSQAQYEAEKATAVSDFTSRSLQRQQASDMTHAAQMQAAAAQQQAIAASMPRSTTCTQAGNTVTCF